MRKLKSNFVVVEGADGAGKTALLTNLKSKLEELGYTVVVGREPGGTIWSELIRDAVLYAPSEDKPSNKCVLTGMFLSRFNLYEKRIAPALSEDKVFLCDRFVASSFAYQVYGKDPIYYDMFDSLNHFGQFSRYQSIVLDVTYAESIKRRGKGRDLLFEDDMEIQNSSEDKFNNLREGVKDFYKSTQHGTYILIDTTTKSLDEVNDLALDSLFKQVD